jgi:NADH:ubiquinone oxidoreductase subunit H
MTMTLAFISILIFTLVFYFFVSRKAIADLQARVGPNQFGPSGFFQPIADSLKLNQKRGDFNFRGDSAFWWILFHTFLFSTLTILPLGSAFVVYDSKMSVLIPILLSGLLSMSMLLFGINQGTLFSVLSGLRRTSQSMAGLFPALVALLCAAFRSKGLSWTEMNGCQGFLPLFWTAFSGPFEFLAMIIFILSGLVIFSIYPMDVDRESESTMSGRVLGLYYLAKQYCFFLWSLVTVVIFLGGWQLPELFQGIALLELIYVLGKVFLLMLVIQVIAKANPVPRVDQVTDFSWKVLSPLSLGALIGNCILFYLSAQVG